MPSTEEKILRAFGGPFLLHVMTPLDIRGSVKSIAQFVVNDKIVGIGVSDRPSSARQQAARAVLDKMVVEMPELTPLIKEMQDDPAHPALRIRFPLRSPSRNALEEIAHIYGCSE
jgi:hypothetical protein